MANKAMWDWMDKAEGRKDSSHANMEKEKERQGYKAHEKKEHMARNMKGGKQHTPRDMEISEAIKRGKAMAKSTREKHLRGEY